MSKPERASGNDRENGISNGHLTKIRPQFRRDAL